MKLHEYLVSHPFFTADQQHLHNLWQEEELRLWADRTLAVKGTRNRRLQN